MDRVYEINRNFRNEGISTQHNPEFTMLEFYQAYSNYHDLMALTQELVAFVAQEVNDTTLVPLWDQDGKQVDLAPENWRKYSMREAIIKFWPDEGARPTAYDLADEEHFRRWFARALDTTRSIEDEEHLALGLFMGTLIDAPMFAGEPWAKLVTFLFERVAEDHLIQPTIIYDFPLAVSPLSKIKPGEPDWVERFEFFIGGFEIGNAFSELNDPDDQRRRFEAQLLERERGDDEAHAMDEDYVRALGYGLPPTAGEGVGIDRLTMVLTGSKSIRDVILFPLLRPQAAKPDASE
jgi:lysyl-tRNA synthetase class 2